MNNIKNLLYFLLAFAYLTVCCNAQCPTGTFPLTDDNLNALAAFYGFTDWINVTGSVPGCCYGFGICSNCTDLGCTGGGLCADPSSTARTIINIGARGLSTINVLSGLGVTLRDSPLLSNGPLGDIADSLVSSARAGLGDLVATIGLGELAHNAISDLYTSINLMVSLDSNFDNIAAGFSDGGMFSSGAFLCCGCGENKKD